MSVAVVEPQPVILVEITDVLNVVSTATPDISVVEITTASLPVRVEVVQPSQYLEVIDSAIRGAPGPVGPPGIQKVYHLANPNYPRPNIPIVYWIGSVQPVNADPDDLLMLKEA
jgi:hypothetical protein